MRFSGLRFSSNVSYRILERIETARWSFVTRSGPNDFSIVGHFAIRPRHAKCQSISSEREQTIKKRFSFLLLLVFFSFVALQFPFSLSLCTAAPRPLFVFYRVFTEFSRYWISFLKIPTEFLPLKLILNEVFDRTTLAVSVCGRPSKSFPLLDRFSRC